jgi:uncharacterized membrane protein
MKNIVLYAVIGALVGLLLAEFFPAIGKGSFESGLNNLAYSLGKSKPYLNFAAVGAIVGVAIGVLSGKK